MKNSLKYARSGIEILAPAGDEEMLRAAVESGADCVYLGLQQFNARRTAGNFDADGLRRAVSFCHGRGAGVYVTLNTLVFPGEIPAMCHTIEDVAQAGADGVIIQDLGVAKLCREIAPDLPRHASTQLSITTVEGALEMKKLGFSRAILGRELTREEIALIVKESGMEIEVFVHGALCMSVSGQCMLSAFLGGRSGNRGMCAGPCRLPWTAIPAGKQPQEQGKNSRKRREDAEQLHHLSLRDQSLLADLQEMRELGVASVKIEGRLKSPEYAAAVVDACRRSLRGEEYDEKRLQAIFSRGEFTSGYYDGKRDQQMFGVRAPEDAAKTRAALPAVRELYRRPGQWNPIIASFTASAEKAELTVSDGEHTVTVQGPQPQAEAFGEGYPAAIRRSLEKTGGTPFYAEKTEVSAAPQAYLPLSEINNMRRQALEQLLQQREQNRPYPVRTYHYLGGRRRKAEEKQLYLRLDSVQNLPGQVQTLADGWYLPLREAEKIPPQLREGTVLEIPRGTFGSDSRLARQIERAKELGFARFEINNIGHLQLLRGGEEISAGFGLNVANPLSAQLLQEQGVQRVTASPECALAALSEINTDIQLGVITYGRLPLMLTRACPLQNVTTCEACGRKGGTLLDRKGKLFSVQCSGTAREIFNPVPLWLGDRQQEVCCDYEVLYFTGETAEEIERILGAYCRGEGFFGEYTRGLYYKTV